VKIRLTNVHVDDQDKALKFYTEVPGFEKKTDVPPGEHRCAARRLTDHRGK
jgi:catechol 2,3-dioxygenase-like lactoylglutathione lyase family enzyme